jgi:butyrate kinase
METILIINLGSTSTKLAVYEGERELFKESVKYSMEDLAPFQTVWDQAGFREQGILGCLKKNQVGLESLDLIACRGGNFRPVPGGIYAVSEEMLADIKTGLWGVHPTCIGSFIAYSMAKKLNIPVITMDPPITDELDPIARYSGVKEIPRISSFHALSQKSTARKIAGEVLHKRYEDSRMIVCHLGGGISVGAHRNGRVVDVNNALDGDGPFSPERAGTVPAGDLIHLCFSGKYTENQLMKMVSGKGGLVSYLGTTDSVEIEKKIENGDAETKAVYDAMIYQLCKEIGAAAAVLCGRVEVIALTGSLAYSDYIVNAIKARCSFIAPVHNDPGENEMRALKEGAMRVLRKQEEPMVYTGKQEDRG